MLQIRPIVVAGLILACWSNSALAWHSVAPADTHREITENVLSSANLDWNGYPDLHKFAEGLANGANTESHNESESDARENLPFANLELNGGYPIAWWGENVKGQQLTEYGALPRYKRQDFSIAYFNIGRMIHLIQDMAVPAHAANIFHATDKLELAADRPSVKITYKNIGVPVSQQVYPYQYYQDLQDVTRKKLAVGEAWRLYWMPSDNAPSYGQDATAYPRTDTLHRGHYAGAQSDDIYNYNNTSQHYILWKQLDQALIYTRAALMSASKRLPPLIAELKINDKEADSFTPITVDTPNNLVVTGMENRQPDVKLFATVGKAGPIISSAYNNCENCEGVPHQLTGNGTNLPFESDITIPWDGKLVGGKYLPEGNHALYVQLKDHDNNFSEEKILYFTMPPLAKERARFRVDGHTTYFQGVAAVPIPAGKGTGTPFNIGIDPVDLKPGTAYVKDPSGNTYPLSTATPSKTFDTDIQAGNYKVFSETLAGKQTDVTYHIDDTDFVVLMDSVTYIDYSTDTLHPQTMTLHVAVTSSAELKMLRVCDHLAECTAQAISGHNAYPVMQFPVDYSHATVYIWGKSKVRSSYV